MTRGGVRNELHKYVRCYECLGFRPVASPDRGPYETDLRLESFLSFFFVLWILCLFISYKSGAGARNRNAAAPTLMDMHVAKDCSSPRGRPSRHVRTSRQREAASYLFLLLLRDTCAAYLGIGPHQATFALEWAVGRRNRAGNLGRQSIVPIE